MSATDRIPLGAMARYPPGALARGSGGPPLPGARAPTAAASAARLEHGREYMHFLHGGALDSVAAGTLTQRLPKPRFTR